MIHNTFSRKRFLVKRFISPLTSLKTPVREINKTYHKNLKFSLIISVMVFVVLLQVTPKKLQIGYGLPDVQQIELIADDITPPTNALDMLKVIRDMY